MISFRLCLKHCFQLPSLDSYYLQVASQRRGVAMQYANPGSACLRDGSQQGRPIRMRLLARKGAAATIDPDPAAALEPVIKSYVELRQAAMLRNVAS